MTFRPHPNAAQSGPNTDASAFHHLMVALLRHMQIPPPSEAAPEVYVLTFDDNLTVRFFCQRIGTADLLCRVGVMPNTRDASALLGLLALNRHTCEGPCLNVGVDPASGAVTIWTRLPIAHTSLDTLVLLLKAVLARAQLVQRYLSGRHTADPSTIAHRKKRFIATDKSKTSFAGTRETAS